MINHLREKSHSSTYGTSMAAPVAQQIITSMSIIMGKDGTKDGKEGEGGVGGGEEGWSTCCPSIASRFMSIFRMTDGDRRAE